MDEAEPRFVAGVALSLPVTPDYILHWAIPALSLRLALDIANPTWRSVYIIICSQLSAVDVGLGHLHWRLKIVAIFIQILGWRPLMDMECTKKLEERGDMDAGSPRLLLGCYGSSRSWKEVWAGRVKQATLPHSFQDGVRGAVTLPILDRMRIFASLFK